MTSANGAVGDGHDPRDAILDANRVYAEGFADAGAPKVPSRGVFVLTCMDARIDPSRALGLDLGDAHIVRNAGGRVSDDVVRSLVISSALLGTRHAMVIHHTDCGLGSTTDEQLRAKLSAQGADVGDLWVGAFAGLDDGVREDVAALRSHPLVRDEITISGHVYDVETGRLRDVDA